MRASQKAMALNIKSVILISGLCATVCLSACSTVKIPTVDFIKFPEFLEEARNIKDYPKVSDAPDAPTDTRSAKAWDNAAKQLIRTRNANNVVGAPTYETSENDVIENVEALKARVRAYKLDDPQE